MLNTFDSTEKKHMRKLEIERKLKEMERISKMHLSTEISHGNREPTSPPLLITTTSLSGGAICHSGPLVQKHESFDTCSYGSDEGSEEKSEKSLQLAASTFRNICNAVQDLSPDNRTTKSSGSWRNEASSASVYRKPQNFRELVSDNREFTQVNLLETFNSPESNKHKRRKITKCIVLATTLVMALVIVLCTTTGKNKKQESYNSPKSSTNTNANPEKDYLRNEYNARVPGNERPTEASTMTSEMLVRSVFLQQKIVSAQELDLPSSPYRLAFNWIVHSDLGQHMERDHMYVIDWTTHPIIRPLAEYYALAVLYFSTQGPNWYENTNWITTEADDYCEYNGVACDMITVQGQSGAVIGLHVVTSLNVTGNGLRGPIPKELELLQHLDTLNMGRNELTGSVPNELGSLEMLETLHLEENQLSGSLPQSLRGLLSLTSLHLHMNQLTGVLDNDFFSSWIYLESLGLFQNNFSGPIPDSIGGLISMKFLYMDSNKFTGTIPISIGELINIEDFRMQRNRLTGKIPSTIVHLTKLEILYLDENKLTGTFPTELLQIQSIEEIQLFKNELSGSLPTFPPLPHLQVLYLDENWFTGSIPESIGELSSLQFLFVENNSLEGTLPYCLGALDLYEMRLSWNEFSGAIPTELGNLSNLEILALDHNRFVGDLPSELGTLNRLHTLKLQENDIFGNMPDTICALADNKGQHQMGSLENLVADCGEDAPQIYCDCCSQCGEDDR